MVRDWGMGDGVGFVFYGDNEEYEGLDRLRREYSDKTAEAIDAEVKSIIDEAYNAAVQMIKENKEKVEAIAQTLLRLETISGDEVNALIRGESIERPGVSDLLDEAMPDENVGAARPVSADPKPRPDLGSGPVPQPG
jgi:cell division protease FtsH